MPFISSFILYLWESKESMKNFFLLDTYNLELSTIIGFLESNEIALIIDTRVIKNFEEVKFPLRDSSFLEEHSRDIFINKIDTYNLSLMINKYKEYFYYKTDIETLYYEKEEEKIRPFSLLDRFIGLHETNEWVILRKSLIYEDYISVHRIQDKIEYIIRSEEDYSDYDDYIVRKMKGCGSYLNVKNKEYDESIMSEVILDCLNDEINKVCQNFHDDDFYFREKLTDYFYNNIRGYNEDYDCDYDSNGKLKPQLRNYDWDNSSICIFYDGRRTSFQKKIKDKFLDYYKMEGNSNKFYIYDRKSLGYRADELVNPYR